MDRFHFSSVECFGNCPKKFELTYRKRLKTLPSDDPQNPLILGTALHRGMETDAETAIHEYLMSFPVTDDRHINEVIKLEHWISRMKEVIPEGAHEVNFKNAWYEGTADLLVPVDEDYQVYDLYDFKYSNNQEHYMESRQLHVYSHYLEKIKGISIRKMFFVFIPKVMIKQKKTETVEQFRSRLKQELEQRDVDIREVKYSAQKVDDFHETCFKIGLTDECRKNETYLCDWCEYKEYCQKGTDYMILPSATRRQVGQTTKRKLWIYGGAFSGKTTFVDSAPEPLNLNTDGNIQFVTQQYLPIKDTYEGRQKILAWQNFKNAVDELEKTAGQNGFKTIVVDLLEDAYEHCRKWCYQELGITHESDNSFKAWDFVRVEFLSTVRKLMNLDYENIILISHEDTSKDITKKTGDKITAIKPNIQDKIATKVAGMVDIVARVVVDGDSRTLEFKSDEVVFGGGRLKNISKTSIPLKWEELCAVYDEANAGVPAVSAQNASEQPEVVEVEECTNEEEKPNITPVERARRRVVKNGFAEVHEGDEVPFTSDEPVKTPPAEPEQRTRRTRKVRSE